MKRTNNMAPAKALQDKIARAQGYADHADAIHRTRPLTIDELARKRALKHLCAKN